jgi:hypothetical protein
MLNHHDERTIKARTATVIAALKKNLADHIEIVQEARAGYLRKATEALIDRLAQVQTGKVIDLHFNLSPPQDHAQEYRTVLKMLELHLEAGEETIDLKAADVQRFVLNDWTWMNQFLVGNAGYSDKSRAFAVERGLV